MYGAVFHIFLDARDASFDLDGALEAIAFQMPLIHNPCGPYSICGWVSFLAPAPTTREFKELQ